MRWPDAAYCRQELAAYKVPAMVEFIPELPKSAMMKILRKDLRAQEIARQSAPGDRA